MATAAAWAMVSSIPAAATPRIDVPGASFPSTFAYGINNRGQIVGAYRDSTGGYHGFLDSDGSFTNIDVPSAFITYAYGVNDSGQIVGSSSRAIFHELLYNGFLYSGGTFPLTVDRKPVNGVTGF
jgi:probable HAF family extracellular repeat protein